MVKKIKDVWEENLFQNNASRKKIEVVLRGAPDDRGIINVGGRIGASATPGAVRKILSNFMMGMSGALEDKVSLLSGSDIDLGKSIEFAHNQLRETLIEDFKRARFPIVIGGGHDYGFPHIQAASEFWGAKKVALINIDAHFDVRPLANGVITSGSPFYMALESGCLNPKNFIEWGIQSHCNTKEAHHYLKSKKVQIVTLEQARGGKGAADNFLRILKSMEKKGLKIVVSVDMDAFQMSQSPGVSAPQSDGLTSSDLLRIMCLCSNSKAVVSLGFFEASPPLDINDQTSRLVATAIHRFAETK